MAGGTLFCFGSAQLTHHTKDKELIGNLMYYHKSMGLLLAGLLVPRLLVRIVSRKPPHLPSSMVEKYAANLTHWMTYGFLFGLSGTGIMMGYYSGYGFPFFLTVIPGLPLEEKRGDLAGFGYKLHKYQGAALEYLIALHVSAVVFNHTIGRNVLGRITSPAMVPLLVLPYMGIAVAASYSVDTKEHPDFPRALPKF